MTRPRAALFDMDRTLVRKDTASLYVRYQRDSGQATWREGLQVAWWMLKYSAGMIDAPRVAQQALRSFIGRQEAWMIETCDQWFLDYVIEHITEAGRHAVQRHQAAGDITAIITGATAYAARPLARLLGIAHVVCTELDVRDGCFTGEVVQPMSYGDGKVILAERLGGVLGFDLSEATFYSDSITDLPLLERVGMPIVVNPDARLRRIARNRGWRIERW
jgi:HAD superfamily hydrolase (TIGR01490 family)